MPTPIVHGTEVVEVDLLKLLPADEGEIDQVYGRIGSGKTYAVTCDVIAELERGQVVYANWKIDWNGYDERESRWKLFLYLIGLKRFLVSYPKENLRWIEVDEHFVDTVSKLTDCKVYLDEGHLAFDSYEMARVSMAKRNAVLFTRHFDRTFVIVSQRPSAIHATLRGNVNRFFKCEKTLDWKFFGWFRLQRFLKTEFQDVKDNDTPNEERVIDPETGMETDEYKYAISQKSYWGRKKVFQAYDTKYRREGVMSSQVNEAKFYYVPRSEVLRRIFVPRVKSLDDPAEVV